MIVHSCVTVEAKCKNSKYFCVSRWKWTYGTLNFTFVFIELGFRWCYIFKLYYKKWSQHNRIMWNIIVEAANSTAHNDDKVVHLQYNACAFKYTPDIVTGQNINVSSTTLYKGYKLAWNHGQTRLKKKKQFQQFLMLMILLVPEMVMVNPKMIDSSFIAHSLTWTLLWIEWYETFVSDTNSLGFFFPWKLMVYYRSWYCY